MFYLGSYFGEKVLLSGSANKMSLKPEMRSNLIISALKKAVFQAVEGLFHLQRDGNSTEAKLNNVSGGIYEL